MLRAGARDPARVLRGEPCGKIGIPRGEFVELGTDRLLGGAGIGIDRPVVAVRCWADTAYNAEQLALKVRDAVSLRAGEMPGVWGAIVNSGPYDSTESTRQPSSQVVFDITCEF